MKKILLMLTMVLALVGCGGVKFNPNDAQEAFAQASEIFYNVKNVEMIATANYSISEDKSYSIVMPEAVSTFTKTTNGGNIEAVFEFDLYSSLAGGYYQGGVGYYKTSDYTQYYITKVKQTVDYAAFIERSKLGFDFMPGFADEYSVSDLQMVENQDGTTTLSYTYESFILEFVDVELVLDKKGLPISGHVDACTSTITTIIDKVTGATGPYYAYDVAGDIDLTFNYSNVQHKFPDDLKDYLG